MLLLGFSELPGVAGPGEVGESGIWPVVAAAVASGRIFIATVQRVDVIIVCEINFPERTIGHHRYKCSERSRSNGCRSRHNSLNELTD